ncbi:hypothetical protein KY333_04325 [Candidatus Woesearchaeota archaeon]|nr:hypothetical protein [Candidatus Woesearchaeota archaeon]MBW2994123.1 hypothetical protein [Candidatus Woesearchaeota archaeon]
MINSDLSDRVRVYLAGVDNNEKALNAACAVVDGLRNTYLQNESVEKKVYAQKTTFAVLNELGIKGYDVLPHYELVCTIIQDHIQKRGEIQW